jgi:hypothetical protein
MNTNNHLIHRQMRRVPQGWRHPFYRDPSGRRCFLPIPKSSIPSGKSVLFQMYEIQTRGTPISPLFDTKEALIKWLVETKVTYVGPYAGTEEDWNEIANQSED